MINEIFSQEAKKASEGTTSSVGSGINAVLSELSGSDIKRLTACLSEEIGEFLQNKKSELVSAKNKLKGEVREHPFLIVAGALAVGALIGMIYKR